MIFPKLIKLRIGFHIVKTHLRYTGATVYHKQHQLTLREINYINCALNINISSCVRCCIGAPATSGIYYAAGGVNAGRDAMLGW